MPCAELESRALGLVASNTLHSRGDIVVWLCHYERGHRFYSFALPSTSEMEAAAYSIEEE